MTFLNPRSRWFKQPCLRAKRGWVPLALLFGLLPASAWAIPSPDLVINLFASIGQILGLLSVAFGGVAVSMGRRRKTGITRGSPWPLRIALLLLVATAASFALYYGHVQDLNNKRLRTNLTRSSTEEGKAVGDISLKTLSYSQQSRHSLGIATDRLAGWLKSGEPLNIIDVREPEETEAGMIPGAVSRPYPEVQQDLDGVERPGRRTVLICFSGNRSSELCQEFDKAGVACHFMVGGYEKWLAEGRPLATAPERRRRTLRDLPDYPNKDVLLETTEVESLLQEERALFVDVRYPGDFAAGHLPGAVNIPLRALTREEWGAALEELPRGRPVIAPCYDKRSCFYAEILGVRLTRAGHAFLGRYTVPHEFSMPAKSRAYVDAWQRAQEGRTVLGMLGAPMAGALLWLQGWSGSFLMAVFLTVVGLRLVFLPFSIKAEIDRLKEEERAPQLAQLKEKLKDQPHRLARVRLNIARADGLTPLRNTVGSVLQLILFLVLFSVVGSAAEEAGASLWWMGDLAEPDPWFLLPAAVTALILLHLFLGAKNPSQAKRILYLLSGGVILLLTLQISAALNLYLAMSIAFLLLHGMAVRAFHEWGQRPRRDTRPSPKAATSGVVPFRHLTLESGGGNKAIKLAELLRAGFPVPDGFVVSHGLLSQEEFSKADRQAILRAWRKLKSEKVAVRSSGLNEDGAEMSYAGMFESRLNVGGDELFGALDEVRASLNSARAAAYSGQSEAGGIVVQAMVQARYAGVMFTEHPATCGSLLIELVEGLGESLVSGQATPRAYPFGRFTGRPLFQGEPPIDLAPLIAMGRRAESHFGGPQDMEWAWVDGRFLILQTRDITSDSRRDATGHGVLERERYRLLELFHGHRADTMVLSQGPLTELLPTPTRLSLSLMDRLWAPGGAVDLACAQLGIPYNVEEEPRPYVVSAFGSLYLNGPEEKKRLGRGPGTLAAFRLSRGAEEMERAFREEFLPGYLRQATLRAAVDPGRLGLEELVRLFREWEREFVTQSYMQADIINIAAEYYLRSAKQELERRGEDPARWLSRPPETVVFRAMSLLPAIWRGERNVQEFLELFGHRAPHDFELSSPRYHEDLELVARMASQAAAHPPTREPLPESRNPVLALAIQRVQRYQALKEEAKHATLRDVAVLRRLLLELDRRLGLEGGIFQLEVEEVARLDDPGFRERVYALVESRRSECTGLRERLEGERLPLSFTLGDLECFCAGLQLPTAAAAGPVGMLRGLRISGTGEGVGRVRVVESAQELDRFREGEILVARFTDPSWTPLFSIAAGVITEVGGWLSHAAIVAREMGVVGIVGVPDATRLLKNGDLVRLHEDGSIEIDQGERRIDERFPGEGEVAVTWEGGTLTATLLNISRNGALLEFAGSPPETPGMKAEVTLRLAPEATPLEAVVCRREGERLGVRFTEELAPEALVNLRQCSLLERLQAAHEAETRLLRVTSEINAELELRPLISKIVGGATELLGAERGSLFLHDPATNELRSLVAEGIEEGREIRIAAHQGIAGQVFTTGCTTNIPDAYADARFNQEVDRLTGFKTRSILCMPVQKGGVRLGVIQLLNKRAGSFSPEDENRLGNFAGDAARALAKAELFQKAVEAAKEVQ